MCGGQIAYDAPLCFHKITNLSLRIPNLLLGASLCFDQIASQIFRSSSACYIENPSRQVIRAQKLMRCHLNLTYKFCTFNQEGVFIL